MTSINVNDIYTTVTSQIVAALEAGAKAGEYNTPWNTVGECATPTNASTGKAYRGVNVLALWCAAQAAGYETGVWATYKQWAEMGAQVRKGEKASSIVFWKQFRAAESDADGADSDEKGASKVRMMARGYAVFNAAQVDGYTAAARPQLPERERNAMADAYFAAIGATIVHGGNVACYVPSRDLIRMPDFANFKDGAAYYSVLAHELTHWTGDKARLDRNLSGRFGSESYAAEELVAELGAAFMCALLGLSMQPRPDHASYIASWIRVLKNDKRAIFTAAAKAQQAADHLDALASAKPAAIAA